MMHFEFELAEHGIVLLTLVLGCLFWLGVITAIAAVMVVDRLIEEKISGHTAEPMDDQGDPDE